MFLGCKILIFAQTESKSCLNFSKFYPNFTQICLKNLVGGAVASLASPAPTPLACKHEPFGFLKSEMRKRWKWIEKWKQTRNAWLLRSWKQ